MTKLEQFQEYCAKSGASDSVSLFVMWVEMEAVKEQSSARIAELEKELNEGYTAVASGINADLNQQLIAANATIEELRRKLAESQAHANGDIPKLIELGWTSCQCDLCDSTLASFKAIPELEKQLSTARAEERAKVMKEVSETPVVARVRSRNLNLPQFDFTAHGEQILEKGDLLIVRPTFKEQ